MTRSRLFMTQMVAGCVLLLVLVALVIAELWIADRDAGRGQPALQQLASYGSAPRFSLTERSGNSVSTDDLRGKVWIADFIYTRCTDTCPAQTGMMANIQAEFAEHTGLTLVSISVDPLNDSPEVLSRYADRHGASADRWLFLTGDPIEIRRISQEGFRLSAVPVKSSSSEPVIFHSSRFILIDQRGMIRGYYDSNDREALERLRKHARSLLAKA